jgi:hypothetical protein
MQMCDALVQFDDGYECWYGSHELRSAHGNPLPTRQEARRENDARMLSQLQGIRARHEREFHRPWEQGAEFGRAIIGKAIDGAINEVKERMGSNSGRPA